MSADVDNKVTFRGRTVSADDVAQVLGNTGSWLGRAVAQIRLSWNLGRWVTPKLLEQEISRSQGPSEQSTVQKVCTAYYATRIGRSATTHTPQITKLLRNAGLPRWSFNRAPELVSLLSKIPGNQLVLEGLPRFWVRKNAHDGITIDPIDQGGRVLQGGISLSKTGGQISRNEGSFVGKNADSEEGRALLGSASHPLWMALDMARNVSTIIDIFDEKASLQNREIQYFHNGKQFFVRKNGDEISFTEGDVNGRQIALILENGGRQRVLQGDHYVEVKSSDGMRALSPIAGIIAAGLEKLKEAPPSV